MEGRVSLNLIAVYATLFLVCLTQARVPHCDKCALVLEPTGDSEDSASESPEPAGFMKHNEDISQAPTMSSPEPSYDYGDDYPTPADEADPPEDDFSQLSPSPSPAYPPEVTKPLGQGVFDVTAYGAVGDGVTESNSAFLSAWKDVCNSNGNSTLLIPNGTFFLGVISFSGPCKYNLSPKVEIRGVLKAPPVLKTDTWILFRDLRNLELTGGTQTAIINGQGSLTWLHKDCNDKYQCTHAPRSIQFINVSRGVINRIAVINSKGFHVSFLKCEYINVHDVNISSPWESPNTDGVHISNSKNITIQSSIIGVGDDCVSIGPGTTNISVLNVTCGPGHGISVGSLGKYKNEKDINGVSVRNCTIKNTTNGVRIKTWPGSPPSKASNISFEEILMINVSNPIIIDQEYCPGHSCKTIEPSRVMLSDISFKNISGTSNTKLGTILHCSTAVPCDNMKLININLDYISSPNKTKLASLSVKGKIHGFYVYGSKFSPPV